MAPLPAPRPLPLAGRTSLSPPPPPRPPFTLPGSGRNESIGRGSSEVTRVAWAPPSPGAHGSGEGERRQADGPTDSGTLGWGWWQGQGSPAKGGRPRAGEEGLGVPRPPDTGSYLPVAPHRAERGENGGHGPGTSRGTGASPSGPGGSAPAPGDPGVGVGGGPGLPRPRGPASRALSFSPLRPGSARGAPRSRLRASVGRPEAKPGARLPRPRSAAPTRVQGGRESARRGRAPGSPPLPPRGPSEAQKGAHCPPGNTFWGAE